MPIDAKVEGIVRGEIESGENLLWAGCLTSKALLNHYATVFISMVMFFSIVLLVFSPFLILSAREAYNQIIPTWEWYLRLSPYFLLPAIGFLFVFLDCLRGAYEEYANTREVYAITNSRLIIVKTKKPKTVQSYNLENLENLELKYGSKDHFFQKKHPWADINLTFKDKDGSSHRTKTKLIAVIEAKLVADLLRESKRRFETQTRLISGPDGADELFGD